MPAPPSKSAQSRLARALLGLNDSHYPALTEGGNIDLTTRPQVRNPDGSISTVRSMSFQGNDGLETLVPTVAPSGTILTPRGAMALYGQTGQHLGKFRTIAAADQYARDLHEQQDRFYSRKK